MLGTNEATKIANFNREELLEKNEELRCSLEAKDHQIRLLEEKINYLLHHRFGSKSERFDERQHALFPAKEEETCELVLQQVQIDGQFM